MPHVTSITMRYSRKFQLGKDNWVGWDALVTVSVPEEEYVISDAVEVRALARAEARAAVVEAIAADIAEYHRQRAAVKAGSDAYPAVSTEPPRTTAEAEQRFFARYGEIIDGQDWSAVQRYLRTHDPKPTSIAGWLAAAAAVRDRSCLSQPQGQAQA